MAPRSSRIVRSIRWVLPALVAAALSGAVAGVPPMTAAAVNGPRAVPTAGGIGIRLVDVPSAAVKDPRARLYIVDHLPPGTVIHRRIEVSNTTAGAAHVALYAAAATIVEGSFVGAAGDTPNELSRWTSMSPAAVDLPAGGRLTTTVTVTVPRDAAPGEQYAVVWAEHRSKNPGQGLVQVNRVGIRLYLSVGQGGPPAANFAIDSLTSQRSADGRPTVVATVHNTGGRALDMTGSLRLTDGPGGLSAGPFPASLGTTLAAGDREPVRIALDPLLPDGPWKARIALRSGLLQREVTVTITFPVAGAAAAAPVSIGAPRPGWEYVAVVALVAVLVLGSAAMFFRFRRKPRLW